MFEKAIVRTPGQCIVNGLTSANLGKPIYERALIQHAAYIQALEACDLDVLVIDADERYPDSTFIEDTALLTPHCAIIMNPGVPSRKGETTEISAILGGYFDNIEKISEPGTAEGGDIMMVGDHFYIGISERTNPEGARQVIEILEKHGLSGSTVELSEMLHLKTGLAYLEENNLVACGEFLGKSEFQKYDILPIAADESYAANCIWVNDHVLVPLGFPNAKATIEDAGYQTIAVDVSEFQKLDGGLSCLSLRF